MALRSARKNIRSAGYDAESALDKIGTATEQVISSVASGLDDTRERVVPAVGDARDKVVPVVSAALAAGRKKGREVAVRAGVVEEKKETHKLRNFLLLLGLGGAAAFVYSRMTGKSADPAWTASRDSAAVWPNAGSDTAPTDTAASVAAVAGPVDESETAPTAPLASEETVESPTPTTPDQPLEKKDV